MATKAIDIVSILHAMETLSDTIGNAACWFPVSQETDFLVEMLDTYYPRLSELKIDFPFQSVAWTAGPAHVSVISLVDIQLIFDNPTTIINSAQGEKIGIYLPEEKIEAYTMRSLDGVFLKTSVKGGNLWIYVPADSELTEGKDGPELIKFALTVGNIRHYRRYSLTTNGVIIPALNFEVSPNLSILLGSELICKEQTYVMTRATEKIRFNMHGDGPEFTYNTGLDRPLILPRPFFGWVTLEGIRLPIGPFYADYDSFLVRL